MPSSHTLAVFSLAAMALLIVPGPAVTYIVTRSAVHGRAAGVVSVVGIHVGTLVHVVAAVVGLSAVIVASATAFTAIKLAGAAYLVWLGVQAIRSAGSGDDDRADGAASATLPAHRLRDDFRDGVVVNVLNPKTAVFFLAFVPQFVEPGSSASAQLAVLGATFVVLGLVTDGGYALAGAAIGARLRRSASFARRTRRVTGVVYVALGAVTAAGTAPSSS